MDDESHDSEQLAVAIPFSCRLTFELSRLVSGGTLKSRMESPHRYDQLIVLRCVRCQYQKAMFLFLTKYSPFQSFM